jgi:hypothetical protein
MRRVEESTDVPKPAEYWEWQELGNMDVPAGDPQNVVGRMMEMYWERKLKPHDRNLCRLACEDCYEAAMKDKEHKLYMIKSSLASSPVVQQETGWKDFDVDPPPVRKLPPAQPVTTEPRRHAVLDRPSEPQPALFKAGEGDHRDKIASVLAKSPKARKMWPQRAAWRFSRRVPLVSKKIGMTFPTETEAHVIRKGREMMGTKLPAADKPEGASQGHRIEKPKHRLGADSLYTQYCALN